MKNLLGGILFVILFSTLFLAVSPKEVSAALSFSTNRAGVSTPGGESGGSGPSDCGASYNKQGSCWWLSMQNTGGYTEGKTFVAKWSSFWCRTAGTDVCDNRNADYISGQSGDKTAPISNPNDPYKIPSDVTKVWKGAWAFDNVQNSSNYPCGRVQNDVTIVTNDAAGTAVILGPSGSKYDTGINCPRALASPTPSPTPSPSPSPGTTSPPSSTPTCGDKVCNSDETCSSCSTDCGACPAAGSSCTITWCSTIPNQPPNTNFNNIPFTFSSCSGDGCVGTYVNRVDNGPWLANVSFPSGLVSCSNPATVNNIWSDSAGVHSIQIAAKLGSVICTPSTNFTTNAPSCDSSPSCSGSCSAPSNTCSTNNGTMGSCVYTTYSGGGSCTQSSAPNQPCTINNCLSGYTCSSGTCVSSTTPWIQVEGDVYSGENIYTPGGP